MVIRKTKPQKILVILAVLFMLFQSKIYAYEASRIYDNAAIFINNDFVLEELDGTLNTLSDTYHIELALLTESNFNTQSSSDYCDNFYDLCPKGPTGKINGILVLINTKNDSVQIKAYNGAKDVLTDEGITSISALMTPYVTEHKYDQAAKEFLVQIKALLSSPEGTAQINSSEKVSASNKPVAPSKSSFPSLTTIILSILALFILIPVVIILAFKLQGKGKPTNHYRLDTLLKKKSAPNARAPHTAPKLGSPSGFSRLNPAKYPTPEKNKSKDS